MRNSKNEQFSKNLQREIFQAYSSKRFTSLLSFIYCYIQITELVPKLSKFDCGTYDINVEQFQAEPIYDYPIKSVNTISTSFIVQECPAYV